MKKNSAMLYCPNCGKQISDDIKFCPYCGAKVYQNIDEKDIVTTQSLPTITILIYIVLNFILKIVTSYSDEIMGIFIYTWIVLGIIFIRRNKDKPFNWLLNIFVSLQAVLVFATVMMSMKYIDARGVDNVGVIIQLGLLVMLLITIIVLLYKGNRRFL